MTNEEIEAVSFEVLEKYVKRGGAYKAFQVIIATEQIKFCEVVGAEDSFVGALTAGNNGTKYIMVNKNIDNEGRKNFTIAHELGHYFLNHNLHNNALFCTADAISENEYLKDPIEREANYFATCLLMPAEKVKNAFLAQLGNSHKTTNKDFLHVKNDYTFGIWKPICDSLTKRYGVSEVALRFRLQGLQLAKFDF